METSADDIAVDQNTVDTNDAYIVLIFCVTICCSVICLDFSIETQYCIDAMIHVEVYSIGFGYSACCPQCTVIAPMIIL